MRYRVRVFASVFTLGALLCLGISLTMYPWGIPWVQVFGAALAYGVVDFVVAFLFTAWLVTND